MNELSNLDEFSENFKVLGIRSNEATNVPVITIYRKVYNNITFKPAGAIFIDVTLDQITKLIGNQTWGEAGYVTIVDNSGQYIYHPDPLQWNTQLSEQFRSRMSAASGHFIDSTDKDKRMVVYHYSTSTNLTIITEVPMKELTSGFHKLRDLTIVIGMIVFGFAIAIMFGLSLSITRPILQVLKVMKKVEMGDLDTRASFRNDEIGTLGRGLNNMLSKINMLILELHLSREKERMMEMRWRESYLQGIQSRINPHFLYNTLEVINSYAIIARVDPISQMTVRLANLFRYSVNSADQLVPLREEVDNIHNYLLILQERYEHLEFHLSISERMLDRVKCFRLVLQPIIENSITHGYDNKRKAPGFIAIKEIVNEQFYELRIIDKGGGMLPELLESYNQAFTATSDQILFRSLSQFPHAIGLWNVHSRLRIAFGAPYGLHIIRSNEHGTEVAVRLPYDDLEGSDDV